MGEGVDPRDDDGISKTLFETKSVYDTNIPTLATALENCDELPEDVLECVAVSIFKQTRRQLGRNSGRAGSALRQKS